MFYTVNEIADKLKVSKSKAYKIIAGRVPKKYFQEKYYC